MLLCLRLAFFQMSTNHRFLCPGLFITNHLTYYWINTLCHSNKVALKSVGLNYLKWMHIRELCHYAWDWVFQMLINHRFLWPGMFITSHSTYYCIKTMYQLNILALKSGGLNYPKLMHIREPGLFSVFNKSSISMLRHVHHKPLDLILYKNSVSLEWTGSEISWLKLSKVIAY